MCKHKTICYDIIYCYEVDCLLHCLLFVSLFIVFLIGLHLKKIELPEKLDFPKIQILRKWCIPIG